MKIVHLCLSNFYIEGFGYQENIIPKYNKKDGHEVTIIASRFTYNKKNGKAEEADIGEYINDDGIKVIRVDYKYKKLGKLNKKFKIYKDTYELIGKEEPDLIFSHGIQFLDLNEVVRYVKNNKECRLVVDNHADYNNSAKNWISKYILHKIIYKSTIQKAQKYIDKFYYLTYETKGFIEDMYNVDNSKMEYLPLGGIIMSDKDRYSIRSAIRKELSLDNNDIMIVHSGKLTERKRTKELIEAFTNIDNENLKLFIIGSIPEEQKELLNGLINNDRRVQYLGWKSSVELVNYLHACDLYAQPGSQSVTMQTALCCESAAMLYPHQSHKYLLRDSVFYVEAKKDIENVLKHISENPQILGEMREKAFSIAREKLDYRKIASKLYR